MASRPPKKEKTLGGDVLLSLQNCRGQIRVAWVRNLRGLMEMTSGKSGRT